MRIRRLISFVVLLVLFVYAAVKLVELRSWFISNKVVFLMNQERYNEAETLMETAPATTRQSSALRKARGKLYAQRKEWRRALDQLQSVTSDAEAQLLKAICYFELGNEEQAARTVVAATRSDSRNAIFRNVIRTMVGCAFSSGTCTVPETFEASENIELMFYEAVAGRALINGGEFAEASKRLGRALELDDQNTRTQILACIASAAVSDFSRAAYFVDNSADSNSFRRQTITETARLQDRVSTAALSPVSAAAAMVQHARLRMAGTWISHQETSGTTAPGKFDESQSIPAEYDLLPGMQWLKAEAMEAQGKEAEAYSHYERLFRKLPNYKTLVRMNDLAGWDEEAFASTSQAFLGSVSIIHRDMGSQLRSEKARLRGNVLCFYQASSAETKFSCAAGHYEIGITAHADRAFNLSPLARINIDGKGIGELYIAREGWDFYTLPVELEAGTHRLEIEYINNSVRLLNKEEDRNMYVREVIVAHAGAGQI